MLNVFIGKIIPGVPLIDILYPNFGETWNRGFFERESLSKYFSNLFVNVVDVPESADYFLLPHSYNNLFKRKDYLDSVWNQAKIYNKKVIVFVIGDSSKKVPYGGSIVFRMSQYRFQMSTNEIIMPAYAPDLGDTVGVVNRHKNALPVVGFCGWASFPKFRSRLKMFILNLWCDFRHYILMNKNSQVIKQGIYFRKKAIRILQDSSLVKTNFIVRTFYSGSRHTIKENPLQIRSEYIKNMLESDFILSPKGDGNFSVRFYEALSLGRIPLLIDTDCILPMQDKIDYSKFVLSVPYGKIKSLPKIVSDFYNSLSNDEYILMQKLARDAFEKYIRIDVFLKRTLSKEFLMKYED